jgi:hypothetical protein
MFKRLMSAIPAGLIKIALLSPVSATEHFPIPSGRAPMPICVISTIEAAPQTEERNATTTKAIAKFFINFPSSSCRDKIIARYE